MPREIRLKHKDIQDSQKITSVTKTAFKESGLNIHKNEVDSIHDDFDSGERVLEVKTDRMFFIVPELPWHK